MSEIVFYEENVKIVTERLILRPATSNDKEAIFYNLVNDKDVLQYYIWQYKDNIDDFDFDKLLERYSKSKMYYFVIENKETQEVMGIVHQCTGYNDVFRNVEIGLALGKKYWNKGYMKEALKAFIDFLFSRNVHKVYASHIVQNVYSGKGIRACNMIYECKKKEDLFYHDRYWDICNYYLINDKK